MISDQRYLELKFTLNKIAVLNDMEWQDFSQFIIEKNLNKGDYIWEEGQISKHLIFLKSGLIRSYSFTNNREITHHFYEKNALFYDDHSFLSQKPCSKYYQILEKSALFMISREQLLAMYDKYKTFERIGRLAIEDAHIKMIENIERLNINSAEENYLHLLNNHPHLLQKISQKIIASYLNITTEHLSRIRSKIAKNQ